ncbi:sigma-54-dependent Fis family transcriptional regulator [Marinobacterium zhoushanense]|uniref:Sigma-54-dependent Fis family transcriptional regulator n=1 Tax=Marinobacterium zhoushanense TaxID=1679163 RepID=A0ABQ1K9P1_9GAMM|nr:sigma-54-dependent Fis family transcriptional regulator [Marinobacterium zhoushanense]GGB87293.1 sigma-54-dependent Fis family transcriptional regulator [Marinobacterium zhoushanense]
MNIRTPLPIPDSDDLEHQIQFDPDSGKIWMHESRMLMIHANVLGGLRRELLESLGWHRAKGILMRFGYESGRRDAELAKRVRPDLNTNDSFVVGPQLHNLEGMVNCKPIKLEFDIESGAYYGEFDWHDSWEGEHHIAEYGHSDEGVCWTLLGYASGYTSYYMGRQILFKETQCIATGHSHCVNIGKPAEEWEDREELERYLVPDPIINEIAVLKSQISCLRKHYEREGEVQRAPFSVGRSPGFQQICALLDKAAVSRVTILLQGETGVGKEVLARQIHRYSERANEPFIAVNCACIPPDLIEAELFGVEKGAYTGATQSREGKFERADRGTIFLDEVIELSPRAQASLLRVLQEGEFERVGDSRTRTLNVRVVAATNENLQQAVRDGRFRADLFFRLNVFPVQIPPLRERREDIAPLVEHFLERYQTQYNKRTLGITDRAQQALMSYHWPGNIRELENMIERGVILTDNNRAIDVGCFFPSLEDQPPPVAYLNDKGRITRSGSEPAARNRLIDQLLDAGIGLEEVEQLMIDRALSRNDQVVSKAARVLGLSRPAFAYRMKKHDCAQETV